MLLIDTLHHQQKDDEQLSNLRKYQQELLTKALKENIIAVSPTGKYVSLGYTKLTPLRKWKDSCSHRSG